MFQNHGLFTSNEMFYDFFNLCTASALDSSKMRYPLLHTKRLLQLIEGNLPIAILVKNGKGAEANVALQVHLRRPSKVVDFLS